MGPSSKKTLKNVQSSFCRRQRSFKPDKSPYAADIESMTQDENGKVSLELTNLDNGHPFSLYLFALKDGMIRIKIDETSPILPRYEVPGTVQELLTQKFNTEVDRNNDIVTLSLEDAPIPR